MIPRLSYVAVVLLILLKCDADSDVQMVASPTALEEGVTPYLVIKCSVTKPQPGEALLSIFISKQSLQGNQQAVELVSINSYDGGLVKNVGNTGAALTGAISAQDDSHISMSFNRPTRNETGLYTCQRNLMDKLGHLTTVVADVLVQEKTTELQKYAITLQDLNTQIKGASACCANLTSTLADLERTGKRLTLALEYVEKNLMFQVSPLFIGKYYYTSKYSVDGVDSAESACEILGGYLAEIQDIAEWNYVSYLMRTAARTWPNRTVTLLGAQDTTAEGTWFWTHSKTPVKFTAWQAGFPKDVNHTENCLGATLESGRTSWIDVSCDVAMPAAGSNSSGAGFLCEVPAY